MRPCAATMVKRADRAFSKAGLVDLAKYIGARPEVEPRKLYRFIHVWWLDKTETVLSEGSKSSTSLKHITS